MKLRCKYLAFSKDSLLKAKYLHRNFMCFYKIFCGSHEHKIKNRDLLQSMIFQTHQLSWLYDNYRRLKPFLSKKFKILPKKRLPLSRIWEGLNNGAHLSLGLSSLPKTINIPDIHWGRKPLFMSSFGARFHLKRS